MIQKTTIVLVFGVLLAGCAEKSLYSWNGYSSSLISYYKNPGEMEEFAEDLREDIAKAEEKDQVPPGLYAEYGFIMLELGDANEAALYFGKERDAWPESAFLMNNVTRRMGNLPASAEQEDGQ